MCQHDNKVHIVFTVKCDTSLSKWWLRAWCKMSCHRIHWNKRGKNMCDIKDICSMCSLFVSFIELFFYFESEWLLLCCVCLAISFSFLSVFVLCHRRAFRYLFRFEYRVCHLLLFIRLNSLSLSLSKKVDMSTSNAWCVCWDDEMHVLPLVMLFVPSLHIPCWVC